MGEQREIGTPGRNLQVSYNEALSFRRCSHEDRSS